MLDQAFEALQSFDWGTDRQQLAPIDEAVVTVQADSSARQELEKRLAAVLSTDISRDAKDFVCRKLMLIGTAASVPALAHLLADKNLSHMARYALERIPAREAAAALRASMSSLPPEQQIGVIGSLGSRRDVESIEALTQCLAQATSTVARAAALALGSIGTLEAAKALASAKPNDDSVQSATTHASLACAERLLADGKKADALTIYKAMMGQESSKHIRLAATRGVLACAGSKE